MIKHSRWARAWKCLRSPFLILGPSPVQNWLEGPFFRFPFVYLLKADRKTFKKLLANIASLESQNRLFKLSEESLQSSAWWREKFSTSGMAMVRGRRKGKQRGKSVRVIWDSHNFCKSTDVCDKYLAFQMGIYRFLEQRFGNLEAKKMVWVIRAEADD